jgi:hypothetical protein
MFTLSLVPCAILWNSQDFRDNLTIIVWWIITFNERFDFDNFTSFGAEAYIGNILHTWCPEAQHAIVPVLFFDPLSCFF